MTEPAPYRAVLRGHGGPEAITFEPFEPASPGDREVLVRLEAIGLNYIDVYHRTGLYPQPLPGGLGVEGAGVVATAGAGSGFSAGERVALLVRQPGSYATHIIVAPNRLVRLPTTIATEAAGAVLLKGCTVEALVERCAKVGAGDVALVHAAAGGVGQLLVGWLKAIGATVIAHAGNEDKAAIARRLGADHALSCPMDDLAGEVRRLTGSQGAAHVFDGVGAASWAASLASVARRGLIVSYGNASGPVPPLPVLELSKAGSVFLTRPTLFDYTAAPGELQASATRLFAMIASGALAIEPPRRVPLRDAAEAHRALEARETTGTTVLIP